MSEEIENAAINVPRAIVTTMLLNGATGFAMVLAILFCLGDVESVLVGSPFAVVSVPSDKFDRNQQPASLSYKSFITALKRKAALQCWLAFLYYCSGARSSVS